MKTLRFGREPYSSHGTCRSTESRTHCHGCLSSFFHYCKVGEVGECSQHGLFFGLAILVAILVGAILTPLLLQWLPGRAFSIKSLSLGVLIAVIVLAFRLDGWFPWVGRLEMLAWLSLVLALSPISDEFYGPPPTPLSRSKERDAMGPAFQIGVVSWVLASGSGRNLFNEE